MNIYSQSILVILASASFCFVNPSGRWNHSAYCEPGSEVSEKHSFTAVFYNTENFYDTINDPKTNDDEFTPQGKIPWSSERFIKKEKNLAQVFTSIIAPSMPDIIGMAEVENRSVLEQLIDLPEMAAVKYGIVHYDSPDERGIDVALLYNTKTFTVLSSEPVPVTLDGGIDRTRDILYVKGKTEGGTILNIFVNHWPSRREGSAESENKRMTAASVLHQKIQELLKNDIKANILVMGDFNDNPDNRSITEGIGALPPVGPFKPENLYDLLYPKFKSGSGSLYYKSWDLFDQIIVSGSMLKKSKGLNCSPEDAGIYKAKFLLYTNNNGDERPNRTMGNKYFGGYSDHLPVYVTFK